MSCPRYVVEIKLYGTDCRYAWKMKTRVGDHKGFQKEMEVLAERGEFERISEGFVKHNGGLAKIEREWFKKVAENKEINKMVDEVESAAVKAAHKVMEQYSEAFEKLAENKE